MKKFLSHKAQQIRKEFESNPKINECTTEEKAIEALESLNWLDYDLSAGQKISMARFATQASAKLPKTQTNRPSIFDRPMRGESMDDFNARQLTGKYDV